MRILGNILWFLLGGLELGIVFIAEGFASFVTIIGIPFGLQWFKMVPLVFSPFGKGIRYNRVTGGRVLGNILWVIIFGWWNAVLCLVLGLILCITIIGIPFGKQWFKLARLLFLPFGAEVYNEAAEKRQEKRERKREQAAASLENLLYAISESESEMLNEEEKGEIAKDVYGLIPGVCDVITDGSHLTKGIRTITPLAGNKFYRSIKNETYFFLMRQYDYGNKTPIKEFYFNPDGNLIYAQSGGDIICLDSDYNTVLYRSCSEDRCNAIIQDAQFSYQRNFD